MTDLIREQAEFFADLTPEGAHRLRALGRKLERAPGSRIYTQGGPSNGLYCVCQGLVKETAQDIEGRLQWVRLVGPGELLGNGELFSDSPRAHTVVALHHTRLLWFPHKQLRQLAMEYPEILLWTTTQMVEQLCLLRSALVQRAYTESALRLTQALRDVAERFGIPLARGILIELDLSRDEWAALVGIAPETVSRVLHQLAERGWIELHGRQIMLLEPSRLTLA